MIIRFFVSLDVGVSDNLKHSIKDSGQWTNFEVFIYVLLNLHIYVNDKVPDILRRKNVFK